MTVFNENLVHQSPNLFAHRMAQIVRVQHPLEEFSLHAALAARLLQFVAQPENVGLERLALGALK